MLMQITLLLLSEAQAEMKTGEAPWREKNGFQLKRDENEIKK